MKYLLAALIVAPLFGLMAWGISNYEARAPAPPAPSVTTPQGNEILQDEAMAMCWNMVKRELKAPATAKIQDVGLPKLEGNAWTHVMNVDAENSFGASLRSQWVCVLDGDTGEASVTQVS